MKKKSNKPKLKGIPHQHSSKMLMSRKTVGINEEGGVGGGRTQLLPWTYQKYIYMWKNYQWKLIGDWQKDSYTTEAIRKIHTELGSKGRKAIGSGPMPLRRCKWKGRLHGWKFSLRSEWFEPHIWHPSPEIQKEDEPPWLVGGPVGLIVGLWEAHTPFRRCALVLPCSQCKVESVDWEHVGGWLASF